MSQTVDDAIWAILEQLAPTELRALPAEAVQAVVEDVRNGVEPGIDSPAGGFGFGAEALIEHVVLGTHIALAVVHAAMMLRQHHHETEMADRLSRVVEALGGKLELTDELIGKLRAIEGQEPD